MLCVAALTSCHDRVEQLSGRYSYKISGSVVLDGDTTVLPDEQGAMELIRLNADSALLTFNALVGPIYTAQAKIDGKNIVIAPYERNLNYLTANYTLTAQGEGTIYDETMVIDLSYSGKTAKLETVKLTMLCKKN